MKRPYRKRGASVQIRPMLRRITLGVVASVLAALPAFAQAQTTQTTAPNISSLQPARAGLVVNWSWADTTGGACSMAGNDSGFEIEYKKATEPNWKLAWQSTANTADHGVFELYNIQNWDRGRVPSGTLLTTFTIDADALGREPITQSGVALDAVQYQVRMLANSDSVSCDVVGSSYSAIASVTVLPANQAPTVASAIADQSLVSGATATVDISSTFSDPENDALTYAASSDDTAKATVALSGTTLTVTGAAPGTAKITVTATDPYGVSVSDEFDVTVTNNAPTVANAISDQTVDVGSMVTVSLETAGSEVFADPDSNALTYAAASGDTTMATVSVDNAANRVTVTGVAAGTPTITVTASDGYGGTVSDDFIVTVNQPNRPPTVANAVDDQSVAVNATVDVDVSAVFTDLDNDTLTLSVTSSATATATATLTGTTLTLNGVALGTAQVTLAANDGNGGQASDTFDVTVTSSPPVVASPIANIRIARVTSRDIDLTPVFSDPDRDTLSYSASSSNTGRVTVSLTGSTLTVRGRALGTATVTVTAADPSGASVSNQFDVTVQRVIKPAAPTNVSLVARNGQITVTWDWFDDTGGVCLLTGDRSVFEVEYKKTSLGNDWHLAHDTHPNDVDHGVFELVGGGALRQFVIKEGAQGSGPSQVGVALDPVDYDVRVLAYSGPCEDNSVQPLEPNSDYSAIATTTLNNAPTVANSIADQTVQVGSDVSLALETSGSETFTDPDGDTLTYSVASSDTAKATVAVSGSTVTLTGAGAGEANITVTADDGKTNGTASTTFKVTVTAPLTFGTETIADQTYTQNTPITTLNLPEATGGDAPLAYTLTPARLPPGLAFDAASRTLSGTPATSWREMAYTYAVTDADGDAASLTFTITVEELLPPAAPSGLAATAGNGEVTLTWTDPGNDSISRYQVRYGAGARVPSTAAWTDIPGSGATTVRHDVTGLTGDLQYAFEIRAVNASGEGRASAQVTATPRPDLTPSFGAATVDAQSYLQNAAVTALTLPEATGGNAPLSYGIEPALPAGLRFDAGTRVLSGTPTQAQDATDYDYTATDADGDAATLTFTITVREADVAPTFGGATVDAQAYTEGEAIAALTLPEATGGNGALSYGIEPALPTGLAFDAATRTLSGTPTEAQAATEYAYTAQDADGNRSADDAATLTFTITVREADVAPTFGGASVDAQAYREREAIAALTLPEATGGNGALSYGIEPSLPAGLAFDAATRTLSGTPTAAQAATEYAYTAQDADGNRSADDAATLTFTIEVAAVNRSPVLASPLADRTVAVGATVAVDLSAAFTDPDMDPLTLAAASGDPGTASASVSGTTLTLGGVAAGTASVTVTATDPSGAAAQDALTVTVELSADAQQAVVGWVTRFGRTVAEQALDGVADRMSAPRTAGTQGAVGGASLMPGGGLEALEGAPWADARGEGGAPAPLGAAAGPGGGAHGGPGSTGTGMAPGMGTGPNGPPDLERDFPLSQSLGLGETLRRSSFTLTGGQDANGGSFALWGRAAQSRFSGRDGAFAPDGEVTSGMLGLDYGTESWLAGVAVAQSTGKGSALDGRGPADGSGRDGGDIRASLISAVPYGSVQATERLKVWGAAGFGSGEMKLLQGNGQHLRSDLSWTMAAAGARGELLGLGSRSAGLGLALTTDALWARTELDRAFSLPGAQGDVSRFRLGLEGSWALAVGSRGAAIVPQVEVGVRHDGGDAETGTGVELGGGLAWRVPTLGLELSVRGRTLVTHAADDLEEKGFAVSFLYRPSREDGLGPSLTLTQDWGGSASGGLDALFATNPLEQRAGGYGGAGRYAAEAAYGLRAFGGRFTAGPRVRLGHSTGAQEYGLGWYLAPTTDGPDLSLGLMLTRSQGTGIDPAHGVKVEISARW